MNKRELQTFAVEARRDLLEKVGLKAEKFGVTEENPMLEIEENYGQLIVNGMSFPVEKKQTLHSLQQRLNIIGYEQLMEEVAYTWFNRIIAIRYMEVNNYLPDRVNVLSSSTGKNEPDILLQYQTMNLDVDSKEINLMVQRGDIEQAFRKLFVAQCNNLNNVLPTLFEKINHYTELLLPDYLLDSEFIISKLVDNEELTDSFNEVEVIGWLYQYYNTEPKDKVFTYLKKNKKIDKYDIPAATQIFTPKWIVRYMIENSLGKLWLEANPNSSIREVMKYYVNESNQDEEVNNKLEVIQSKSINLEDIKIMDPCAGSGHILVYAFDLLYLMYKEAGYPITEIPQIILEKNLFGMEIDGRAAQLATFALLMKAREKSRRIFKNKLKLNIFTIEESSSLDIDGIIKLLAKNENEERELHMVLNTFIDGKFLGSIIQPPNINYEKYIERINNIGEKQLTIDLYKAFNELGKVKDILKQSHILSLNYDVVVTNPPFMGNRGMNPKLLKYIKKHFSNSRYDLFSVFMERCYAFSKENGFISLITQPSWLQLSYYRRLREFFIDNVIIQNLLYMGRGNFGIDFGSTAFVMRKSIIPDYKGEYFKLYLRLFQYIDTNEINNIFLQSIIDKDYIHDFYKGEKSNIKDKVKTRFNFKQKLFKDIPNSPISFWINENVVGIYKSYKSLKETSEPRAGLQTGENEKFVRYWHEIEYIKMGIGMGNREEARISGYKWFPYNKGGDFRKWFGNNLYVVNWYNDGEDIREDKLYKFSIGKCLKSNSKPKNVIYYFRESLTWSFVSSGNFGVRYSPKGAIFDIGGSSVFPKDDIWFLCAFLNSKIAFYFLKIQNDTMNFQVGNIASLPVISKVSNNLYKEIEEIAKENVKEAQLDWDSYEISWNFKKHPFLMFNTSLLKGVFNKWLEESERRFYRVKENEEKLNQIFIDLYSLQDVMGNEIEEEVVIINQAELERDTISFLSYFIGCVMGRYSLDVEGLAYAGGEFDGSKYKTFKPNLNGLILLTDDHYFENDIIVRLREFLSVAFSPDTVDENMNWLAESLGMKKNESPEERLRRYFLDEFFGDHCQTYNKRPIYWLVDSGRQKGLRTLIYMHRYQPDTMATIRFDHLQEIQAKYQNGIKMVDTRLANPNLSATERRSLEGAKTTYQKKIEELQEFDKHLATYANEQFDIDLDDGVKVNYAKFDKVLAKIR